MSLSNKTDRRWQSISGEEEEEEEEKEARSEGVDEASDSDHGMATVYDVVAGTL